MESREKGSKPHGILHTCSNSWEFDMRRPWVAAVSDHSEGAPGPSHLGIWECTQFYCARPRGQIRRLALVELPPLRNRSGGDSGDRIGMDRDPARKPPTRTSELRGKGQLRSEPSLVPKGEEPGAPSLSEIARFAPGTWVARPCIELLFVNLHFIDSNTSASSSFRY